MTRNQIAFQEHKESVRHNMQTEDLGNRTLAETNRHNIVTENETYRHNTVYENETHRHNTVSEAETYRHNTTTERISADANVINAQRNSIMAGQLSESIRHNVASENISAFSAQALAAYQETNAAANYGNMLINRQNATTNALNAATNQQNAATQRENVQRTQDREDKKLPFQQAEMIGNTFRSGTQGVEQISRIPGNIINAMSSFLPNVKDVAGILKFVGG